MPVDDISARAARLHSSALVIDAHADTPQRFLFEDFDLGHRDAEGSVDIPRLRAGNVGAIFFAIWVPVEIKGPQAARRALDLMDATLEQIRRHADDLVLATTSEEIVAARAQEKIAVLMGVEGGHAINNDLAVLRDFRGRGARYMTLTHTAATDWADCANQSPRHGGLTEFGKEVIREMNRLGMIVDVSHVSDKTFQDVIEISRAPVIASHSCCRALCDVPRNLSDDMIKRLAEQGGVIHITFHKTFVSQEYANARRDNAYECLLREQEITTKYGANEARKLIAGQQLSDELVRAGTLPRVSYERIVDHIAHAVGLVGEDHVGFGSDFDGAYMPEGMRDAGCLPAITDGLYRHGYTEVAIRKILGENTLRVLAEAEQAAVKLRPEKH